MKKIRYILLGLTFLVSSHSYAQQDTDFWFAVPRYLSATTILDMDDMSYLVLSCLQGEANVTISLPAMPTVAPLHYKVGKIPIRLHVGYSLDCINCNIAPPFNVVSQRGIHIESDIPIQCYFRTPGTNSADYTLKGRQGLGKEFIITMQHELSNCWDEDWRHSYNSFELVATEDNTIVTIYPSNAYYQYKNLNNSTISSVSPQIDRQPSGYAQTSPVTIVLNRGETYAMRSRYHNAGHQLTGTRIVANKPIAVTGNDESVNLTNGCDSQGDQLYPTSMAGTEFIVADCNDGETENGQWESDKIYNTKWHGIYVYPLYDNTKVTFNIVNKNGSITKKAVNLNKESLWDSDNTRIRQTAHFLSTYDMAAVHVTSSKPIMLSQVNGLSAESGIAMVPPLNIMGMKEFIFDYPYDFIDYPDGIDIPFFPWQIVLHLITKNEYADGFRVNGVPLTSPLHPIAGTDYSFIAVRKTIKDRLLHVTNTKGPFQAGIRYGGSKTSPFTYFADLSSKGQVVITDTENPYDETNNTPGTLGDNGKEELFYPNVIRMGSTYYTCPGNDVQFEAKMSNGTAISSPQWTLPNGQVRTSNPLSIHGVTTADVGEYSLRGIAEGETVEATFSLTVPDSAESNIITRVAMCEGATYTWPVNNQQYTAPAKDTIIIYALIDGQQLSGSCTTNIILDLQANNGLDTTYLYYSLTPGDTLNWYGEKITGSTVRQRLIETKEGCSTQVYLIVKVNDGLYDEGVDIPNLDRYLPDLPEQPEEPGNPSQPENPGQSEEIDPESLDIFVYQDNSDAVLVLNTGKHEANINIYSTIGTRVFSAHKDLNTDWFVMPLPVGTYIALIELDNKLTVKKKFVIRE